MARAAAAFAGLVLSLATATRASPAAAQQVDPRLIRCEAAYRALALQYRAGLTSKAVNALQNLDRGDLGKVVSRLKQRDPVRFAWERPALVAAGLVHVEATVVADRAHRQSDFTYHAELAVSVLEAADLALPAAGLGVEGSPTARRGALLVGLLLLGEGNLGWARAHLSAATLRFPMDAPLRLAYGTALEAAATEGLIPANRYSPSMYANARSVRTIALNDAARELEGALVQDPSLVEARIRLGHVQILQHDDATAARTLNEALAVARDPSWVYIARLLVGGIRERAGSLDGAMGMYAAAANIRPNGQSAYIALSHAMHKAGDSAAAAQVLDRLFARKLDVNADDPWWRYRFGNGDRAREILAALQEEIKDTKGTKDARDARSTVPPGRVP